MTHDKHKIFKLGCNWYTFCRMCSSVRTAMSQPLAMESLRSHVLSLHLHQG